MADLARDVVRRIRNDGRCAGGRGCDGVDDRRQRRIVDVDSLCRIARLRRRPAITATTASPTKRAVSTASAWCGGDIVGLPSARRKSDELGIGPTPARTRSAPVRTACTPGIAAAASTPMCAIAACACGERTKYAYSWPGAGRLSENWPRPRNSASSSTRAIDLPLPKRLGCEGVIGNLLHAHREAPFCHSRARRPLPTPRGCRRSPAATCAKR